MFCCLRAKRVLVRAGWQARELTGDWRSRSKDESGEEEIDIWRGGNRGVRDDAEERRKIIKCRQRFGWFANAQVRRRAREAEVESMRTRGEKKTWTKRAIIKLRRRFEFSDSRRALFPLRHFRRFLGGCKCRVSLRVLDLRRRTR